MGTTLLHGTAVAYNGVAVLLRGASGTGKSDLALRLIDAGWVLVSDDQTVLEARDGRLMARAPATISGKIEVRGLGLRDVPALSEAPVAMMVDLVEAAKIERMPEPQDEEVCGVAVRCFAVDPFAVSAVAKVRHALQDSRRQGDDGPHGGGQADRDSAACDGAEAEEAPRQRVLIVTGMSGAGRSTALKILEDIGYEAIDNLPLDFLARIVENAEPERPIAIAEDIRSRNFAVQPFLRELDRLVADPRLQAGLLFLDCDDEVLVRRFAETRRRHPLAEGRPIADGIAAERQLVAPLRDSAQGVVDTTSLTPSGLRQVLAAQFGLENMPGMLTFVTSFSYREGIPREADLVFDVRFLKNPHYDADLRPLSGQDQAVVDFIAADPAFQPFVEGLTSLLAPLLPLYEAQGKSYLKIAVGCTGGRHRSVALAERLAAWLRGQERMVTLYHRDMERERRRRKDLG
ncbi:MAG TPA: RNase adapter RapZ [Kiloniellaceae bacterium]|nr:RNase adapter RapZ [Kiloniellaceae bacterium]